MELLEQVHGREGGHRDLLRCDPAGPTALVSVGFGVGSTVKMRCVGFALV